MRIAILVPNLAFLLVPVGALAADANSKPPINCKSASALSAGVDWKTYSAYCDAEAASDRAAGRVASSPQRAAAPAEATATSVASSLKTPGALSFANVPTWTDAEIVAQFIATRDARYMTTTPSDSGPPAGFQRRISWMYPDDGCFARAEQVHVRVDQAGFQNRSPYKLFAMSYGMRLRVYTDNAPGGVINWNWHVVPVVKNSAGTPIVLDAALSPCRPLPWREWLALMADNPDVEFNDPANGHGVGLGDSNAYYPSSLTSGEPSHADQSLSDETGTYLWSEWYRQMELHNDVSQVIQLLGDSPRWSGNGCVATLLPSTGTVVAPNTVGSVTATCPIGTLAVGGGLGVGDPQAFKISKNARTSNGWQITAKNTSSSSSDLTAQAICLVGAPSTTTVSSIQGNVVSINPGSYGSSTASCNSGTLVAGGYTTDQGSPSVMRIYNTGRTSSTGRTWQVSAQNTTSTAKKVTAFAYCLPSTGFTFSQSELPMGATGGMVACPQYTLGGGYKFPRTSDYKLTTMFSYGSMIYVVGMVGLPSGGDSNAKAYAECMSFPSP